MCEIWIAFPLPRERRIMKKALRILDLTIEELLSIDPTRLQRCTGSGRIYVDSIVVAKIKKTHTQSDTSPMVEWSLSKLQQEKGELANEKNLNEAWQKSWAEHSR